MKTLILSAMTAATLMFASAGTAEAGKFQLVIGNGGGYGGFGGGYGGGWGAQPGYNPQPAFGGGGHRHHGVNPGYNPGVGGHFDYHDTSHYDYIPGRWVKHGCHWDWQPGRYVYHQDGHFDLHH
ncbi:MAG: hypothetical protein ACK5Q5_11610 [Planctomycetaceae bacterium]